MAKVLNHRMYCALYRTGFEVYGNCPPAFCKSIIDQLAESEVKDLDSSKKITQILSGKVHFWLQSLSWIAKMSPWCLMHLLSHPYPLIFCYYIGRRELWWNGECHRPSIPSNKNVPVSHHKVRRIFCFGTLAYLRRAWSVITAEGWCCLGCTSTFSILSILKFLILIYLSSSSTLWSSCFTMTIRLFMWYCFIPCLGHLWVAFALPVLTKPSGREHPHGHEESVAFLHIYHSARRVDNWSGCPVTILVAFARGPIWAPEHIKWPTCHSKLGHKIRNVLATQST